MHGTVPRTASAAISAAPGTGIIPVPEPEPNPGTGVPEPGANPGSGTDDWFYDAALAVFGKKEAGWHLHLATGWPRTSCYAFVARDAEQRRKPPVHFLRILFHSEHGRPFFLAFMHGCSAAWWCEFQRAHDVGRDVIARVERE